MMLIVIIRGEGNRGMQETRRHILEVLRERGESTVDDLVTELRKRRGDNITAVTVRHHLAELLKENLITHPQLRHRGSPGRPQHIYTLTVQARNQFPNNYHALASNLLSQITEQLPQEQVNVILEGVADRMAAQVNITHLPFEERLERVIAYLNEHGYSATWEEHVDGYILRTANCPYHQLSQSDQRLCEMDMRLIASMLGVVPRLLSRMSQGDLSCSYLVPASSNEQSVE
jgi:predicted ArsR family transcriptional regulator